MALTIENGSGVTGADSYATLAEYQAYAADYDWTLAGSDANDEVNLRKGRKYLDQAYIWKGYRVSNTQPLEWPRYIVEDVNGFNVPSDAIPEAIKIAQMEMAHYIQVRGEDPFAVIEFGGVIRERKKVDVIEKDTTYESGRDRPVYPSVDNLVAPYIAMKRGTTPGSVMLTRA